MAFEYKAMQHGTLSNPYRFIAPGDKVTSEVPINASWLVPVEKAVEITPLPLTPYIDGKGNQIKNPQKNIVPPVPESDAYKAQMKVIKENEDKRDAKAKKGAKQAPKEGTGNQDVL